MMSRFRYWFVVTACFIFVACALVFTASAADEPSAASAVEKAETDSIAAYEAMLAAEQAGADVSNLVVQMNNAVGRLAEAEVAYRLGDFNESVRLAGLCSELSSDVKAEAEVLRLQASGAQAFERQARIAGSLASMVAVVVGGFWSWRLFKRRYCRRVLAMKPEVVAGDA